jgi:hypothetical protein
VSGVAARGSLYRVELDRAGFASDGDAFLFGAVLHQVFALKSINEQRVMADPIGANPSTRTSLIVGLSLLKFALVQRGLL